MEHTSIYILVNFWGYHVFYLHSVHLGWKAIFRSPLRAGVGWGEEVGQLFSYFGDTHAYLQRIYKVEGVTWRNKAAEQHNIVSAACKSFKIVTFRMSNIPKVNRITLPFGDTDISVELGMLESSFLIVLSSVSGSVVWVIACSKFDIVQLQVKYINDIRYSSRHVEFDKPRRNLCAP